MLFVSQLSTTMQNFSPVMTGPEFLWVLLAFIKRGLGGKPTLLRVGCRTQAGWGGIIVLVTYWR